MRGFRLSGRKSFVMPTRKYPKELVERGVRLAIESERPVAHVAAELGLPAETLRKRVRQAEADQGLRPDLPTSQEREEIKELKRENAELRRANEILRAASLFFASELDESRPK
jgi:transposase